MVGVDVVFYVEQIHICMRIQELEDRAQWRTFGCCLKKNTSYSSRKRDKLSVIIIKKSHRAVIEARGGGRRAYPNRFVCL